MFLLFRNILYSYPACISDIHFRSIIFSNEHLKTHPGPISGCSRLSRGISCKTGGDVAKGQPNTA